MKAIIVGGGALFY